MESFQQVKSSINKSIYCLMITGKDDYRYEFAKISIINFLMQTYDNKYLVIINHGQVKLIDEKDGKKI
ncbi:MAG: hypothetical protein O7C59_05330 [Rickettsia endosymbiont of Ixodes persulcatus]|nr:hypothetical protein [Rickettsia endosymbiont of Ixodes persulcatus]